MKRALTLAATLAAAAAPVRAQDLRPTAQSIAVAWERGDVGQLGGLASRNGMDLDFYGERLGPVAGRQAANSLRRLFDERETLTIRLGPAREVKGETRRAAWIELTWITRVRGTSIPDSSTVFLALELDRDQWRITEIRIMR